MELPITSGDSHLLHILEAHADDLLSERRSATGLQGLVENQLLSMLPSGGVQMAAVAQQLGMSERSFKRYLAHEGTTFGEILDRVRNRLALRYLEDRRMSLQQIAWLLGYSDLDRVRNRLALRYLEDRRMSLQQIAWLLGYSEIEAFNHAFKRWTGTSPGRARNLPALSSAS
jgi:AraC-like DNA-binding protein